MLAKGFILGKDALSKAKELDEKHQFTSTASAKVADLDKRIGLSEKISVGTSVVNDKFKEMDQKYQVSEKTKSALTAAEQKVEKDYVGVEEYYGRAILASPRDDGLTYFEDQVCFEHNAEPEAVDLLMEAFNETEIEFMLANVCKIWQRFLYRDSVVLEADRQKSLSGRVDDWAVEFIKLGDDDVFATFIQVSRMLLGGMNVVGLYIWAAKSSYKTSSTLLWQV